MLLVFCLQLLFCFCAFGASTTRQVFSKLGFQGSIDIAKSFPNTDVHGCTGVIRNGQVCGSSVNKGKSYSDPLGSKKVLGIKHLGKKYGSSGGSQFYQSYNDLGNEAILKYEVLFHSKFDWKKGGKLPGLHGGNEKCSGGYKSDGETCWSTRLMWRENGAFETYAYLPLDLAKDSFCSKCTHGQQVSKCSDIWHSWCAFDSNPKNKFSKNKWHKIEQRVKMNTIGKHNGVYELKIDGSVVSSFHDVVYRSSHKLGVNGLYFSTFFGGGDSSYAPKEDQLNYFKNFKLYTK